jgi:hypothetical protein
MRLHWRLALAALVAAAVFGGLLPHGLLSGAAAVAQPTVQVLEEPLSLPISCDDAVCGKGSPVPAAPSPAAALSAMLGAVVATAAAVAMLKHRRAQVRALPAGVPVPPFHPPQFS